ncbi:MAG: hypothetical protein CMO40_01610 [Verrucomicrobiaceae bacterium]|nr:hypothetical protein [Verrucomicrobiaceae bacterium]
MTSFQILLRSPHDGPSRDTNFPLILLDLQMGNLGTALLDTRILSLCAVCDSITPNPARGVRSLSWTSARQQACPAKPPAKPVENHAGLRRARLFSERRKLTG